MTEIVRFAVRRKRLGAQIGPPRPLDIPRAGKALFIRAAAGWQEFGGDADAGHEAGQ